MRKAGEECGRQIQALLTGISQDRALYQVLSGLDLSGQDRATRWWMERELRDFRRAGVDRDEATRERVRALNDDIVATGQEFDRNIREGTRTVAFAPAELDGLPDDFRKAHPPGADGRISLTTDYPDYKPFMAYARAARRARRCGAPTTPARRPTPRCSPASWQGATSSPPRWAARTGPTTSPRTR